MSGLLAEDGFPFRHSKNPVHSLAFRLGQGWTPSLSRGEYDFPHARTPVYFRGWRWRSLLQKVIVLAAACLSLDVSAFEFSLSPASDRVSTQGVKSG